MLAMVTYVDRACIGVLAGTIRADLNISMTEMGYIFSAFTFAYAIFEIPSAWWGEKIGARLVLARIVAWWSAFTFLTATAVGFKSLWIIRFLFGAGEAGAWPNATRVFSRWIPAGERGRMQGIFFSGAHLAAGLTPPLVLLMTQFMGWRVIFIVFGVLGFLWSMAWLRWFRDHPHEHSGVNAIELEYIREGQAQESPDTLNMNSTAWRTLFANSNVWLLCVIAFANSYGFYFIITWLPSFLETLGFSKATLALYAGLPMLLAVPADLLGGVTTDMLARRFGIRLGRALVGGGAYAVAATSMFCATRSTDNPHLAAVLLATAGGASMFALPASWASCIEIGKEQSGIVSATMNTIGQVGAMLSPVVLAWLVERSGLAGRWELPLQIIAALYLLATFSWIFINPRRCLKP
jgi:MFS family permease